MNMPLVLVTGGSGQVGTGIARANDGRFTLVMPTHAELDLSDAEAIATFVGSRDWAAIINCAAYTAVDRAESEPTAAYAINAEAPRAFAQACAVRHIPLLQVSTDYVFDGTKLDAYTEDDPVAPLGVYGASKEAGERAVRDAGGRYAILRTAWVVSPWGNNFIKTMLRLGAERDTLKVVTDQHGCPTSAQDIAETLLTLAERFIGDPKQQSGTWHFVNAGEATWHVLATHVLRHAAIHYGRKLPAIDAITTADFPTPARRPANSRLSTAKLTRDFAIRPREWQEAIDTILKELVA